MIGVLVSIATRPPPATSAGRATTAVLAALSAVITPDLWPKWIAYVLSTGVSPDVGTASWIALPLLLRLPAAALLVVWGARTNRPWTLPTASMLALPVLWLVGLAMLTAAFALSVWGPLRSFGRRWAPVPEVRS